MRRRRHRGLLGDPVLDQAVEATVAGIHVLGNPRARSEAPELFDEFGALGPPPEHVSEERRAAEEEAERVFDRLVELVPPDECNIEGDIGAMLFALEDLGSVDWRHAFVDPESMLGLEGQWRSEDWYDDAEMAYDRILYRPQDLSGALGVNRDPELTGDLNLTWEPELAGDLIHTFSQESNRFGGETRQDRRVEGVPDWLFKQQIADTIYPDPRWGKLVLRAVPKEQAYAFVKEHHSALGGAAKLPPGLMYAVGAYQLQPFKRPVLVAVALAGQPTGPWGDRQTGWLHMRHPGDRKKDSNEERLAKGLEPIPERPVVCHKFGVLDLTRIASVGGLYTTKKKGKHKGKRVPLNASSMLAARMMDLLPLSGRHNQEPCLFTTYSMPDEKGTTYLSLVSKGLRPVELTTPKKKPSGGRSGGAATAMGHVGKVRWEYGPAAFPPDWDVLDGIVPDEQIERAAQQFERYEARQRDPREQKQWGHRQPQGRLFNPQDARYQELKRRLMR